MVRRPSGKVELHDPFLCFFFFPPVRLSICFLFLALGPLVDLEMFLLIPLFIVCLYNDGRCVELVDIKPDGDDIVQSSMITPFPSGVLHPDEPNFFWSGSGDDPDAGMTYWITTTVYKTAVVTMTPITPKPSITTATFPSLSPITPTPPTRKESSPPTWPVEVFQTRNWIRTVIRSDADESSLRFRQLVQSRLGRIYSDLLQRNGSRTHVIIQNITRKANDVDVIYSLWNYGQTLGGSIASSYGVVEPYLAVGAARRVNVTRELCHRQANDTQQDVLLCQSVVTQAERNSRKQCGNH